MFLKVMDETNYCRGKGCKGKNSTDWEDNEMSLVGKKKTVVKQITRKQLLKKTPKKLMFFHVK